MLQFEKIEGGKRTVKVFCLEVEAPYGLFKKNRSEPSSFITYPICQGILKRIFSKQICFSYDIQSVWIMTHPCFLPDGKVRAPSYLIFFKMVCWDTVEQRKRYLGFKNLPIGEMEAELELHKNKSLDNFCGEFFKRLKRGKFEADMGVKEYPCRVREVGFFDASLRESGVRKEFTLPRTEFWMEDYNGGEIPYWVEVNKGKICYSF